jgi:hypothetical protein
MYVNAKHRAGGVPVNIWTGQIPNTQARWLERICSEFWKTLTFCVQISKLENFPILGYHSNEFLKRYQELDVMPFSRVVCLSTKLHASRPRRPQISNLTQTCSTVFHNFSPVAVHGQSGHCLFFCIVGVLHMLILLWEHLSFLYSVLRLSSQLSSHWSLIYTPNHSSAISPCSLTAHLPPSSLSNSSFCSALHNRAPLSITAKRSLDRASKTAHSRAPASGCWCNRPGMIHQGIVVAVLRKE